MLLFGLLAVFIFGTLVGSFLNVVILRLPAGHRLTGRSVCMNCGSALAFYDLVPVLSYLWLGGRCRNCRVKISSRYWLIEIATGCVFVLVAAHLLNAQAVNYLDLARWLFASALLIAIFAIDLEHFLILDRVLAVGLAGLLVLNFSLSLQSGNLLDINSHFLGGLAAGFAASALFFLIWYFSAGRWMGFGDVKLVLFLGMVVGWPMVWLMLLFAFWLGAAVSVPLVLLGKKRLESAVPFGTFLTGAAFLTLFIGKPALDWYLRLIGV